MKSGRNADAKPYLPFYVDDWLTSSRVRKMTYAQKGLFIEALSISWREGKMPETVYEWTDLFADGLLEQRDIEIVMRAFPDGLNPRLERERSIVTDRLSRYSLGAQITNAKRTPSERPATAKRTQAEAEAEAEALQKKPPARPRAPRTGAHPELLRFWEAEWARTRGTPWAWTPPDLVAISKCLKLAGTGGQREVEERISRILENQDRWTADNASPRILASHWNAHGFKIIHKQKTALQETLEGLGEARIIERKELA